MRTCPECKSTIYKNEEECYGGVECITCIDRRIKSGIFVQSHGDDYGENDVLEIDQFDFTKNIIEYDKVIKATGGDGTLLKAIFKYRNKNKPFFGVAGGTENFLMNKEDSIELDVKKKKFRLIKALITYKKPNKRGNLIDAEVEYQAFNEISIGGDMSSWISFDVHDKDKIIGKFKGSGVIFSTAQGSTGINRNNGGNILPLSSDMWYVTGDKTNRHISVPIEPKRTSISMESRTPVTVWIDGQNKIIKNVTSVEISKGDEVVVYFNDYDEFKKKRRV